MESHVLVINGSLGGSQGNTSVVIDHFLKHLSSDCEVRISHLAIEGANDWPAARVRDDLQWADGFVFATGTYWDSWGSPLQIFLEKTTAFEGSSLWLGKPAAVLVTMHSVGGKTVLSRLQGVLSTLGCCLPPMSGLVYSLQSHLSKEITSDFNADFWQLDDLQIVANNLKISLELLKEKQNLFLSWPVDSADPHRRWLR